MLRAVLLFSFSIFHAFGAAAKDQTQEIVKGSQVGCIDYDMAVKAHMLETQGDEVAVQRLLSSIAKDSCRTWEIGAKVYIDDPGWWYRCLRAPGEITCFWTYYNAVNY